MHALALCTLAGCIAVGARTVAARTPLDTNLAYSSPFSDHPQFARDTEAIHKRHVENFKREFAERQVQDASGFDDEHYPTFYGSDFNNSPFVWSGGITFTHSVASGDPHDTSVLLWTRAVPTSYVLSPISAPPVIPDASIPVCVSFTVYTDSRLSGPPVAAGEAYTSYDVDFTVKVEAGGLRPDTRYWFRFADCTDPGSVSPVGRTRTFASADTSAEEVNGGMPLTLAVFSCSQYQAGWFNTYGFAAQNISADAFVHLGDYIYEWVGSGAPIGRGVLGPEAATLFDYRQRLNQYRTDASLVAAHQSGPWITDDHEVGDNSWKGGSADSNDTQAGCAFSGGAGVCFTDRKLSSVRAYHEWMPLRQVAADDKLRIWRNFRIGKLLDLTMLDTRQYDRDVTFVYYNSEQINSVSNFENRSIMSFAQEKWFYDTLLQSKERGAVWRVVGQQIVFTQLNQTGVFDLDAWDGYRSNRRRVLDHIVKNEINNVVILSGDSHANWVSDLAYPNDTKTYDSTTGSGALGVEFAGTAVSSPSTFGAGIAPAAADALSAQYVAERGNANLQWSEGSYRGFFALTIDPKEVKATFYAMRDLSFPNLEAFVSAEFSVLAGANKLSRPVAGGSVSAGVLKSSVVAGNG
ncbi:hypothetical protein M0805_005174 [Coniferiporia weirii]|nr:hypothetical protein M0805_005174 [Coniferiporia weirii]